MHSLTLLGQDHVNFGRLHCTALNSSIAASISVGSSALSPSSAFKGSCANEDALFAWDDGQRWVVAVADAHYGHFASHFFIEGLSAHAAQMRDAHSVQNALIELGEDPNNGRSATTLLIVGFDRSTQAGFGVSFGDSSCVHLGKKAQRLNRRTDDYLCADTVAKRSQGRPFDFSLSAGERLLVFTDGIDECHYRHPRTSVSLAHMLELHGTAGPKPETYAQRLTARALNGVNDNPGGQDNIALVVIAG